ncbi:MAG: TIGR02466 family protein [Hyphomicrobiaceae bacterium]
MSRPGYLDPMARIATLFPTRLYQARLTGRAGGKLVADLVRASRSIAADDTAGQRWSREHAYPGYTSYASLNDLPWRAPEFADLAKNLDGHAKAFARALDWDLSGRPLVLDSLWINVLAPGGAHGSHIHPLSVLSGTVYLEIPKGASALKLEDPRHGLMMAAPPRKPKARSNNRSFIEIAPKPGTILMWESWLRHEVPANRARSPRVSASFNYRHDT